MGIGAKVWRIGHAIAGLEIFDAWPHGLDHAGSLHADDSRKTCYGVEARTEVTVDIVEADIGVLDLDLARFGGGKINVLAISSLPVHRFYGFELL